MRDTGISGVRRWAGLLLPLGLFGLVPMEPAFAQGVDCPALKAQIDAQATDALNGGQISAALRQTQHELERTQAYSDSIGCGMFIGAPLRCGPMEARMERMRESIDQLRERLQDDQGDEDWNRRALIEQYNVYCTHGADTDTTGQHLPGQDVIPIDPDAPSQDMSPVAPDQSAPPEVVHSKALCVRHCDGGFFPLSDDANAGNSDRLDKICRALCPNTEASLYTVVPSAGLETAVAPDGSAYTSLKTAFKFQKTYDPACTCKPPNQSWVEALAEAEKMLEKDKSDVIVTKQMSDQMARPVAPASAPASAGPSPKPAKPAKTARRAKPPMPTPITPDLLDPAPPTTTGEEITRQYRRVVPTL